MVNRLGGSAPETTGSPNHPGRERRSGKIPRRLVAGITLGDIGEVFHGTTVATNAILEGKGATVGLVTTKGFRQVLQIARSFVPDLTRFGGHRGCDRYAAVARCRS